MGDRPCCLDDRCDSCRLWDKSDGLILLVVGILAGAGMTYLISMGAR